MNQKYIHIDKLELFCNRCLKYINKYTHTYLLDNDLHCLNCHNWLCGEKDAFGDIESNESPSITHVKIMGSGLTKKNVFIAQFLKLIYRILNQQLPDEDFESDFIKKAWEILAGEVRHIISVL